MRILLPAAVITASAFAGDLEVTIEIPRLQAAEYHRPYVAMWVERPDQTVAANLAVWYDQQSSKPEAGTTWLKDLRQWWRKAGREMKMPVDGVSGATRPAGTHTVVFKGTRAGLAGLPAGPYQLVIEAAREVGGREILRVPFQWPATGAAKPGQAKGQSELGAIQVTVKP